MIAFKHSEMGNVKLYYAQLIEMYKSYKRHQELDESFLDTTNIKRYGRLAELPTRSSCRMTIEGDKIRIEELKLEDTKEIFELNDTVILVKSETDRKTVVLYTPKEFEAAFKIRPEEMLLTFNKRTLEDKEALDLHFNGEFLMTLMGNDALPPNLKEVKKYAKFILNKLENKLALMTIPMGSNTERLSEDLHKNFRIWHVADKKLPVFGETSLICPYLTWGRLGDLAVFKLSSLGNADLPFGHENVYFFEGDKDHFAQLLNIYLILSGMVL